MKEDQKLKMIQVYSHTHELIRKLAFNADMSVRKYMEKIAKEKQDETVRDSN